jgi:signal transduction histidine kinase
MLMPASSEFVALCRSQVALLTTGFGAALSVVYLTEELVDGSEAKLIPVVVYPETAVVWKEDQAWAMLPEQTSATETLPRLLSGTATDSAHEPQPEVDRQAWQEHTLGRSRRILLPLIHEGVVMGLLVTGREDRPWNEQERANIEQIAQTLTIACLLDQQRAWYEQRLRQQQRLQAQQGDRLDDLLHQFRNPLTALRTFGKLLLRRLTPKDANHEVAKSIVRESDRLQELLQQFDTVIELSTVDASQLTQSQETVPVSTTYSLLPAKAASVESFAVSEILTPLLISAQAIAQERNLELVAHIPPDLPCVQADSLALREVLSNLIDNALKYTPPGGEIYVEVGQEKLTPKGVYQAIAISNTGTIIPPEDLAHLFERHYRGIQAGSEISGTGLGLAIAKELIEQMQGEIEVISPAKFSSTDEESLGTTFCVWLKSVTVQ